ncbi:type I DNA topoisomerase [Lebetimonas sp. JH292]|uniref:type I DNA topoisomerase n=1 Tax=Lebetimonas sp. JH292 TaxID=990068 RepID=UPI0004658B50|nr:type I DNA topoisomerase [Lebetimonas sp. JH292]
MSKNLIIVESPAKAKTIKNFLGKNYEVVASKGHIRDLPKTSFGIKIEDDKFFPQYRVTKDHQDIAKKLKELAKKSENIYIATDEDREGEAIGFHIANVIGKNPEELPRIVFHEITKTAIKNALKTPKKLDINRVNAQQARRLLDRIVGYKLSPLLNKKIQKGLSAGRVQSSALKLIVDREREIKAFVPQEYWSIEGVFKNKAGSLIKYNGKKLDKFDIKTKDEAGKIVNELKPLEYTVTKIEKKKTKVKSPAPFMTSTLQQVASSELGFGPRRTMQIAQKLYEGVKTPVGETGIITYMRTDSLNIAKEAQDGAVKFIKENIGENYAQAKTYKTKSSGAQEAHEAIRPVDVRLTPEDLKNYLTKDELKSYTLIYNRFLASQMKDAEYETQNIYISNELGEFKISGKKLIFDGFYKVYGKPSADELLPEFSKGEKLKPDDVKATQHFTKPPERYTEASLIKKLESLGIGRPSTYAPTVTLLQNRNYVEVKDKKLFPTEIAFNVIETLEKHFPNIVDANFTANMEEMLDKIAENKKDWQEVLKEFYKPFMDMIDKGYKEIPSQKIAKPIDETCPLCGAPLVIRKGRFGEFIACSSYPKCKYTRPLEEEKVKKADVKCDKCGADMVIKKGKNGEFLACSNYPKCKNTKPLNPPEILEDVKCPECGGDIIKRKSRRGEFYGCSNYPKCKFISKYRPTNEKCPECGYLMAKRTYRGKEVLECIKCKTRKDI